MGISLHENKGVFSYFFTWTLDIEHWILDIDLL